jgi:hypothetical protein
MQYVSADTNWFGSYSGALFEAEGCDAWWWNVSELEGNLGLDTGERNITISYETLGEKTLRQRLDFGGPTMSELRIEVDYELDGPANQFIDQFGEDWRMRKLSWTVSDHGFIAKRNAWCAKAAGISEEEFIRRHLAAVARFLQLDGMIANPEALAVYEKYAREGGELVWETATASAGEVGGSQAQTLAGFIAASGSTLRHGETVAYAMPTAIAPRDWPNGEFDSVWDIVVHEGGGAIATSPAPETAAANAAPVAAGTAAPAPVETPATVAAEPDIAASTDAPPAVAAAPPGSALLDANYRAAPAPRRRAERERLEYDRLELRQRVLVTLAGNRELRGEVEAIDAKEMVLRVRMGGGYARMTLARTRIEKITAP